MESICKFISSQDDNANLRFLHFVYEAELSTLTQPFFYSSYYVNLVTRGSGTLKVGAKVYSIEVGTLFIIHPTTIYFIEGTDDLAYMYVSCIGKSVPQMLEQAKITKDNYVFTGLNVLIDFWQKAIHSVSDTNGAIIAQSVFLYTLGIISSRSSVSASSEKAETLIANVIKYADTHYRDSDLTVKKVASIFFYTEKHISVVFKRNMGCTFKEYVTKMRMSFADGLIKSGETSVSNIARMCGYTDPLYFSRVFSEARGISPKTAIKNHHSN